MTYLVVVTCAVITTLAVVHVATLISDYWLEDGNDA